MTFFKLQKTKDAHKFNKIKLKPRLNQFSKGGDTFGFRNN